MNIKTAGQEPGTAGAGELAAGPGSPRCGGPDLDALYRRLAEADEAADAAVLAALAWELYGLAGSLMADRDALRARLQASARPGRAGRREPAGKRLRGAYRTVTSEPPSPSPR